jgi:hypothetical protein
LAVDEDGLDGVVARELCAECARARLFEVLHPGAVYCHVCVGVTWCTASRVFRGAI